MDILSLVVGFLIGVVVVAIAIEFGTKKKTKPMPSSRRTEEWSVDEIENPKIMAEYLGSVVLPKNSKVLVNRYKDRNLMQDVHAKQNTNIKGNYILGPDRALILAGPVKQEELGIWTIEKEIVKSLHEEFDHYWHQSEDLPKEDKKKR